jgi:tetratricopeptide (TPR) repeat protein
MAEKHLRPLLISALAGLAMLTGSGAIQAQDEHACGSLRTHYGPFDFRRTTPLNREIVERAHFDRGVETLTRGLTGPFGGDIWYTLAAYPNHPRALQAMERLAQKEKKDPPTNSRYTVECLYERAIRFQPDDHVVRMLYANFLFKRGDTERAFKQMDYVVSTTQDDPLAQFNAGMLYIDMKAYDKGLAQAHKVMAMGFTRRELKDRLTAAGHWVEPAAPAQADAASAAQAGASAPR